MIKYIFVKKHKNNKQYKLFTANYFKLNKLNKKNVTIRYYTRKWAHAKTY